MVFGQSMQRRVIGWERGDSGQLEQSVILDNPTS